MSEERIPKLIMEGVQAAMTARNLEQDEWRNGVWFPEDGDNCYKTAWIDRLCRQIMPA
jgi:hypothetical protein